MRKVILLLVEALALAAVAVTAITINAGTKQMTVTASQIADRPQESATAKIAAFAKAAGTVAVLAVRPQSAKSWPQ